MSSRRSSTAGARRASRATTASREGCRHSYRIHSPACSASPDRRRRIESMALDDYIAVADFRASLRAFLRQSERVARQSGLTPQRYLLLLMIKGAPDGSGQSTVTELVSRAEESGLVAREQSGRDGRVAFLRLTPEGDRRLELSFTGLATEREQLRRAVDHLQRESPSSQ